MAVLRRCARREARSRKISWRAAAVAEKITARHASASDRMMIRALTVTALLALCPLAVDAQPRARAPAPAPAPVPEVIRPPADADWRSLATPRDVDRLAALPAAWAEALEGARAGGQVAAISAAGALLDSRPAADAPRPPDGTYRCRVLRFGAADSDAPAFIAHAPFRCRIRAEAGTSLFEKLTGSQRIAGAILPDSPTRAVLIGTEASGGAFPAYGTDAEQDRIAAVERVGADRWRLVFPRPTNGAVLEVMELVRAR